MGVCPSKPHDAFLQSAVKDVVGREDSNTHIAFGLAAMQGWRATMEDAHIAHVFPRGDHGFFAVLDGHSGSDIAVESEMSFVDVLESELPGVHTEALDAAAVQSALTRAFIKHDLKLGQHMSRCGAGSTCVSVFVSPSHVVFANAGDSRAIFVRDGQLKAETVDHKPGLEAEKQRIYAAGGVVFKDRVDGMLGVSRGFGDFDFKRRADLACTEQKVSPEPDTTAFAREAGTREFVLLACDGVWDVMTSKNAAQFVHRELSKQRSAQATCEALVRRCLELGSQDNLSAVLVLLQPALFNKRASSAISTKSSGPIIPANTPVPPPVSADGATADGATADGTPAMADSAPATAEAVVLAVVAEAPLDPAVAGLASRLATNAVAAGIAAALQ